MSLSKVQLLLIENLKIYLQIFENYRENMKDSSHDTKYKKDMNLFFLERSAWTLVIAGNTALIVPRVLFS